MASKHKQEDPWAGFVDVLSNILMVVIFLVVILGISIFAISQQVTKVAVENAVKEEREKAAAPPSPPQPAAQTSAKSSPETETPPEETTEKAEKPGEQKPETPVTDVQDTASGERGSAGDRKPDHGLRLRETDEMKGDTNLAVRSRKIDDNTTIEVAGEQVDKKVAPVKVESSQAFMSLGFAKGSFRLDPKTTEEIQKYITQNKEKLKNKVEIRAFAQSTIGSISEARRIAFYRAMLIRSELVKGGIPLTNVNVVVRESTTPEDTDVARIYSQ